MYIQTQQTHFLLTRIEKRLHIAMKKILISFFVFFIVLLFISANHRQKAEGILSIIISNVDVSKGGKVRVAIYNSQEGFLEPKRMAFANGQDADKTTVRFDFKMPHGDYAVTSYQDFNGNRTLDRNTVGIPVEPFALSNSITIKWRKPTFNETKFGFYQQNQTVNLSLKYWQDR
jgi:uncharacterized protein (DUF2141 family)